MKVLFDQTSKAISKVVTNAYSTSFSLGIKLLSKDVRTDIYSIYGFVRYADEIVDSFHDYDQDLLLTEFIVDYEKALERKISLNPVLNAFQDVVHRFDLFELVEAFLESMKLDLEKSDYITEDEINQYIYGSADVVGLMCLKVFVKGNQKQFTTLKPYAMKLGSAFQKVNFLRDIKDDYENLGRSYLTDINENNLTKEVQQKIVKDIKGDFKEAKIGIDLLPRNCRLGVFVAYRYYLILLEKIQNTPHNYLLEQRIRISDSRKLYVFIRSYVKFKLLRL